MPDDSVQFDFSEITKLAADLTELALETPKKVVAAGNHAAFGVKRDWRAKIQGTQDLPVAFLTIDYDMQVVGSDFVWEIGSRTGRKQATFVTVIEFGAPGNNLAPHGYGAAALVENSDDFAKGMDIATGVL